MDESSYYRWISHTNSIYTVLEQTARNLFFHVPMWMAMYTMFLISFYHSINYLRKANWSDDIKAQAAAQTGFIFEYVDL